MKPLQSNGLKLITREKQMAINNPAFGQTDAQMAKIFGLSAPEFQKVKKQIIAEMTKPKPKVPKVPKAPKGIVIPKPKLKK
jgi:hypothetical protein